MRVLRRGQIFFQRGEGTVSAIGGTLTAGDLCIRSCVSLGGGNHYAGPAAGVCAAVVKNQKSSNEL